MYTKEQKSKAVYQTLSEKVQAIYTAIEAAKEYAEEHQLTFRIEPAYGMGGRWYPTSERDDNDTSDGWLASSESC